MTPWRDRLDALAPWLTPALVVVLLYWSPGPTTLIFIIGSWVFILVTLRRHDEVYGPSRRRRRRRR
jgi:hypothetical protein